MKIGILETGPVVEALVAPFGTYGEMFTRFLHRADPDIETASYVVYESDLPSDIHDADGWIVSGSKYGAYEDHPWIPPLEEFLRQAVAAKVPVAGFCFGHQILAQALGGKVVKSDKGWGLGIHQYDVAAAPSWMTEIGPSFAATAIHQDQVVTLPEGAHVLASSEFCPHAALAYGNLEHPTAISVQPHPEFEPDFTAALIDQRIGAPFPVDRSLVAKESLSQSTHNRDWSRWVAAFFRSATAKS